MSLSGRSAIVTGGGSGIGRGIAFRLAKDGAAIGILDLDADGGERVAREIRAAGGKAVAVPADVASFRGVGDAVERVRAAVGGITILVNNAGIGAVVPLARMTEEQWDRMIDVHMKGTFNCTRAVIGDMLAAKWGRIVSISSVAGLQGARNLVHYSAAKAGIVGFTKALAQEVGRSGITVNAIAPGVIDTPILQKAAVTDGIERLVRHSAVGRRGRPEDMAAACAYMVSEEASFLTGQVVSPNGGIYF